jgi:hypothetical protein
MSDRWIIKQPFQLSTSALSGKFEVNIPRLASNIAVLNKTGATLVFTEGQVSVQPQDAVAVDPHVYIGLPLKETQILTIFWSTQTLLSASDAKGVLMFSNEPINISGGAMTTGGVASNVQVTNTPNVNVNNMPNVDIQSLPALAPGANHIGEVAVSSLPNVVVSSLPAIVGDVDVLTLPAITGAVDVLTLPALVAGNALIGKVQIDSPIMAQASTQGFTAGIQVAIGTGSTVIVNGVTNARTILIQNFDTSNSLYLGIATVTTANAGTKVAPGGSFSLDIVPGSNIVIYGVASVALTAGLSLIN